MIESPFVLLKGIGARGAKILDHGVSNWHTCLGSPSAPAISSERKHVWTATSPRPVIFSEKDGHDIFLFV